MSAPNDQLMVAQRMVVSAELSVDAQLRLYQSAVLLADEVGMKRCENAAHAALDALLRAKLTMAIISLPLPSQVEALVKVDGTTQH